MGCHRCDGWARHPPVLVFHVQQGGGGQWGWGRGEGWACAACNAATHCIARYAGAWLSVEARWAGACMCKQVKMHPIGRHPNLKSHSLPQLAPALPSLFGPTTHKHPPAQPPTPAAHCSASTAFSPGAAARCPTLQRRATTPPTSTPSTLSTTSLPTPAWCGTGGRSAYAARWVLQARWRQEAAGCVLKSLA